MKILLMCAGGMSTSLLVTKMIKYGKEIGRDDLIIDASAVDEIEKHINDYDFFLLGPQIRYKEKAIREALAKVGKKCAVIPPEVYGRVDGKRALEIVFQECEKNS